MLEIEPVGEIAGIPALTNGKGPGVSTGAFSNTGCGGKI
jgi:hypothetical protein